MRYLRSAVILIFGLSLLAIGGFTTGCSDSSPSDSKQDNSDGAGVEDAVEYGTGERQIEQGEEIKKSLDESTQKKKDQLDKVQESDE